MRGLRLALVAVAMAAVFPVSAQQKSKSNAFDGRYGGTMNCSGGSNSRFGGLTIRQSKFTFSYKTTRGAGTLSCPVQIKPDGSFENQDCDLPTTGRVDADKVEFSFKSPERLCDVHLTREKS